jgi:hypothetical protein
MFPTAKCRSNIVDSEYVLVRQLVPTGASPATPRVITESEEKVKTGPPQALQGEPGFAKLKSLSGSLAVMGSPQRAKGGSSLPPQLNNTMTVHNKIRYFVGTTSSPVSCSVQDMLGALGGTCTVANSLFKPWSSSFKIESLTCYPSTASTAPNENFCALWWNAGPSFQQRDVEESKDVPQGVTATGAVVFRPPKSTLAGDWLACTAAGTTNLFTMFVSAGSIIDLHVSHTLSNQFIPATMSIGVGVLGTIYYLALDGPLSNTIVPAHLPTTH